MADVVKVIFCRFVLRAVKWNPLPLPDMSEEVLEIGVAEILLFQSMRSFSTSPDQASGGNNLCTVLTWTECKLMIYSKKIKIIIKKLCCVFLVEFVLPKFSL